MPPRLCRLLSKQMCGCCSSYSSLASLHPSPPPPFHSVRLVLVGVRQENAALWRWGVGGVMCVVSVVFGGGDSRAALPPQLLSQIRALYTHVPPSYCLSYITHPVQQRTRENETPTLNPKSGEGIEGQEVSLGGVLQGQGYHGERRVFFKWHFTSNLKASN